MYLILKMLSCSREQRDHSVFIISGGPTFNKSQCDIELRADKWCKRKGTAFYGKTAPCTVAKKLQNLIRQLF